MQSSPPDGMAHEAWPIKPCRLVREDVWMPPPFWNPFPTLILLILPATKPVPLDLHLPLHLIPSLPEPSLFKASPLAQLFSRAPLGRRQVVCQCSILSHQMTHTLKGPASVCAHSRVTNPPNHQPQRTATCALRYLKRLHSSVRLFPQHAQPRCYFWITTDV